MKKLTISKIKWGIHEEIHKIPKEKESSNQFLKRIKNFIKELK